ncbi:MAG: ASKHA domain-containing protein [Eubacterium aggregans]
MRSVQLAKTAIYTGCELLVKAFGISGEELEEIVVAGAFGSYVNFHNAQRIGLFPDFKGVPACTVRNAAGIRVQRLLSAEETKRCTRIPRITTHIELATDPEFTKEHIKNTRFKEAGGRRT